MSASRTNPDQPTAADLDRFVTAINYIFSLATAAKYRSSILDLLAGLEAISLNQARLPEDTEPPASEDILDVDTALTLLRETFAVVSADDLVDITAQLWALAAGKLEFGTEPATSTPDAPTDADDCDQVDNPAEQDHDDEPSGDSDYTDEPGPDADEPDQRVTRPRKTRDRGPRSGRQYGKRPAKNSGRDTRSRDSKPTSQPAEIDPDLISRLELCGITDPRDAAKFSRKGIERLLWWNRDEEDLDTIALVSDVTRMLRRTFRLTLANNNRLAPLAAFGSSCGKPLSHRLNGGKPIDIIDTIIELDPELKTLGDLSELGDDGVYDLIVDTFDDKTEEVLGRLMKFLDGYNVSFE